MQALLLAPRLWERFAADPERGCWLWQGAVRADGYGAIAVEGRTLRVHRVVWTILRGDIPDGMELDHLCRVRHCANPDHLEPVTHAVNQQRSLTRLGPCKRDHPESAQVRTRTGARQCRACQNVTLRARRAAQRKG